MLLDGHLGRMVFDVSVKYPYVNGILGCPHEEASTIPRVSPARNGSIGQAVTDKSVDLHMGPVAHLTAAKDRNGRFSGYYKCSHCNAEFRPNPKCPGELTKTFVAHVRVSHPPLETQRKDGSPALRAYRRR